METVTRVVPGRINLETTFGKAEARAKEILESSQFLNVRILDYDSQCELVRYCRSDKGIIKVFTNKE